MNENTRANSTGGEECRNAEEREWECKDGEGKQDGDGKGKGGGRGG